MKNVLVLLIFSFYLFSSCGSGEGFLSDEDSISEEDLIDTDIRDDDKYPEFDFVIDSSEVIGTISRDLVSCVDSIVGGGDDSEKGFVFKMKDGKILWKKDFDSSFIQSVNAVTCDPVNGTVFVGGDRTRDGENRSVGFIAVLDSSGTVLWEDEIKSEGSVAVYAISYTELGFFIAGGRIEKIDEDTGLSDIDGFITKYHINGEKIFFRQFGTPSFDTVQSVTMGADKFYFAGGYSAGNVETNSSTNNTESGMQGFLVKFKPEGDVHWRKNIDMNTVWKITGKADGMIFAGGEKTVNKKRYGVVVQTGLDGKSQFVHRFDSQNGITVTGIDVQRNKNVYFTGYIDNDFSKKNDFLSEDGLSTDTNNIFMAVFDIGTKESLYTKFYGTKHQDLNPKIVLDDSSVPHILHYSLADLQTQEGYVTMTRFLSSGL
jgi:hypothetical protein